MRRSRPIQAQAPRDDLLGQQAAQKELASLLGGWSDHQKDLLIACPAKGCGACEGRECRDQKHGIVHFGRRLARVLKGIR